MYINSIYSLDRILDYLLKEETIAKDLAVLRLNQALNPIFQNTV